MQTRIILCIYFSYAQYSGLGVVGGSKYQRRLTLFIPLERIYYYRLF